MSAAAGIAIVEDYGRELLRTDADDGDRLGHGTMCAAIIAAVAPGATILPVRVFGETRETSADIVAAALGCVLEVGADVVNLSLGTTVQDAAPLLRRACRRLCDTGAILVAADPGTGPAPACLPEVIAVRPGGPRGGFRLWPARGAAPAQDFIAVTGGRGQSRLATTASFAAALVSGLVARVRQLEPDAGADRARDVLRGADGRSLDLRQLIDSLPSSLVASEEGQAHA